MKELFLNFLAPVVVILIFGLNGISKYYKWGDDGTIRASYLASKLPEYKLLVDANERVPADGRILSVDETDRYYLKVSMDPANPVYGTGGIGHQIFAHVPEQCPLEYVGHVHSSTDPVSMVHEHILWSGYTHIITGEPGSHGDRFNEDWQKARLPKSYHEKMLALYYVIKFHSHLLSHENGFLFYEICKGAGCKLWHVAALFPMY